MKKTIIILHQIDELVFSFENDSEEKEFWFLTFIQYYALLYFLVKDSLITEVKNTLEEVYGKEGVSFEIKKLPLNKNYKNDYELTVTSPSTFQTIHTS